MAYIQLTFEQRCEISAYWKAAYLQKTIAKEVGVSESTISHEIRRNRRWIYVYSPEQAQACYEGRRRSCRKKKSSKELEAIIKEKIVFDWSPEQIIGYGKRHQLFYISHEIIYQFILKDKLSGGKLYLLLHHGKKKYKKRYGSKKRTGPIKNRVFIDERPAIVDQKERIGDWEIDTIIGKQPQKTIVTLVNRVSKKTLMSRVIHKRAIDTTNEILKEPILIA